MASPDQPIDGPPADARLDAALEPFLRQRAEAAVARAPSFEVVRGRTRTRAADRDRRTGAPLALVGLVVAALVAIGLGLLATGGPGPAPAPPGGTGGSPSEDGSQGLERPLRLPQVSPGAPCPMSPTMRVPGLTPLPGSGPVYPETVTVDGTVYYDPASIALGGPGVDVTWVAAPGFHGPVLVRGARLDGVGRLAFGRDQLPELSITPYDVPTAVGPAGWFALETDWTTIPGPGCYAYQLDGLDFSTVVVFRAASAAALESALERPLHLPTLPPGAACPVTPPRAVVDWVGPAIGGGPVYSIGYDATGVLHWAGAAQPGGWRLAKILWLAQPGVGPILIRGAQLDGARSLAFGDGADPSADLVLRASDAVGVDGSAPGWSNYVAYTRIQGPGCYAYQVDTESTSEIIVFAAAP